MGKIIEAFIQMERHDCNITAEAKTVSADCKIARLKIGRDVTTHLVTNSGETDVLFTRLQPVSKSITRVGKNALWVEGNSCATCRALSEVGAVIVSSKVISPDIIVYRILAKSKGSLKKIVKFLEDRGLNPQVTIHDFPRDLTAREAELIYELYVRGFFDDKRKETLTEIAGSLGISSATLSESTRRAMKKIIRDYLENIFLKDFQG